MKAQELYDCRERYADIDGTDLHWLFEQLSGDPSPAGRTPIDAAALRRIGDENAAIGIGAFVRRVLEGGAE